MNNPDPQSKLPSPSTASGETLSLTEKQRWLCGRLDELYKAANRTRGVPSDMFRSALYVMQPVQRGRNPDWMAQSAHSLRELLYPFFKSKAEVGRRDVLSRYGVAGDADALSKAIAVHYSFMTSVAHHEWEQAAKNSIVKTLPVLNGNDRALLFEAALSAFEDVLFRALQRQLDVHAEIDAFVSEGQSDADTLRRLLTVNFDARRYFFTIAPEHQLDWLRDNAFLQPIWEVPESQTNLSYHAPELDYLVKVAATQSQKVVDIMLSVAISANHFNPQVLDLFLWICQNIPADQLARILPKLRDEGWTRLSRPFSSSGFAYQRMFQRLTAARNYGSVLVLAEAVLAIRSRDDEELPQRGISFNPFLLNQLEYTKIFESVASVDDEHAERALALTTSVLSGIVQLGDHAEQPPFALNEPFSLLNKDLFEIQVNESERHSPRENIGDLAALATLFIRRTIGRACAAPKEATRLYQEYLVPLPDSRSMWCLKLLAMSLCPQVFREELKEAIFRIFDCETPTLLTAGAEYHRALNAGFTTLDEEERADFFSRVLVRFAAANAEVWTKNIGWKLLSSAYTGLTEAQLGRASEVFGRPLDPSFAPGPAIERGKGGWVSPKAPVTLAALTAIPVPRVAGNLKVDWSPARLREQDAIQEFLNPMNAEGMGRLLKADFPQRAQLYLNDAELFFHRDSLHPHYTYAFISGVTEAIRAQKYPANADWSGLIQFIGGIVASGRADTFDRSNDGGESGLSWLAGWNAVYRALADLVEELLKGHGDQPIIDVKRYRKELFAVISELLVHPDPEPEAETKSTSDPFTNAINSIRGDGLQALIWLMHREASAFPADEKSRVAADVKELYERTLKAEHTLSVMFLFGHQFVPVYIYDREWAATLFPRIFPAGSANRDLYLAAWEGYLTREPFGELLLRLADYYERALKIGPSQYTKRSYHTELDEGVATHLALAFVYAPEVDLNSDLLKLFWEIENPERHQKFVEFIGRHCILRMEDEGWTATSTVGVNRLQEFWDWALDRCAAGDVLAAFGYWMKADAGLFENEWLANQIRRTLERTKGVIKWEHGMMESLRSLASVSPGAVLESLRLNLLVGRVANPADRRWVYVDDDLVEIFKILYVDPATTEPARKLINDLLPLGNGQYWRLKEALRE
jgi:hypothetical protein